MQEANQYNKEWLIFKCGEQEYGIGILNVQELRGYQPNLVTRVAKAPEHVQGLINLRGQIIPVVDLRQVLGVPNLEVTEKTVIVILHLQDRMIGIVVDSVSDVLDIEPNQIQPAPKTEDVGGGRYLVGLFTHEQRLIQLMDIAGVLDNSAQILELAE